MTVGRAKTRIGAEVSCGRDVVEGTINMYQMHQQTEFVRYPFRTGSQ